MGRRARSRSPFMPCYGAWDFILNCKLRKRKLNRELSSIKEINISREMKFGTVKSGIMSIENCPIPLSFFGWVMLS